MEKRDLAEPEAARHHHCLDLIAPGGGHRFPKVVIQPNAALADLGALAQPWRRPGRGGRERLLPCLEVDPVRDVRRHEVANAPERLDLAPQVLSEPRGRVQQQAAVPQLDDSHAHGEHQADAGLHLAVDDVDVLRDRLGRVERRIPDLVRRRCLGALPRSAAWLGAAQRDHGEFRQARADEEGARAGRLTPHQQARAAERRGSGRIER